MYSGVLMPTFYMSSINYTEDANAVNNALWKSTLEFTNSCMNPGALTWKGLTKIDNSEQINNKIIIILSFVWGENINLYETPKYVKWIVIKNQELTPILWTFLSDCIKQKSNNILEKIILRELPTLFYLLGN